MDLARGYLRLSAACLTTTFVITQYVGACNRIATGENQWLKQQLLPPLANGDSIATLGISHLTTSHRHLARPVLAARAVDGGWILNGFSPWVTSGRSADHIVLGAQCEDGRQLLVALPTRLEGVKIGASHELVGLSASQTGRVDCEEVFVDDRWRLAGPVENVLGSLGAHATGGLQTSALAIGLSMAAVEFIHQQSKQRPELLENFKALQAQVDDITQTLLAMAAGEANCTKEMLRFQANSLVLRATQSALVAAKGAGYVEGHPVGRWCREALFFLVWSCPQGVLEANLCELAGIETGS